MSWPLKMVLPLVGVSSRMSSLARVDLPQPDSPTIPSVSPRCSWKDTPSTAWTSPTCRLNTTPLVNGKCLTRSCTSRTTSSGGLEAAIEHLTGEVACAGPAGDDLEKGRPLIQAHRLRVRATRVELASRRDSHEVGRQALDRRQVLALEIHARDGLQQALGVRVRRPHVDVA